MNIGTGGWHILRGLFCFVGWHKWVDANNVKIKDNPYPLRTCPRCKRLQEGTYDMTYGCTSWSDI